MFLSLFRADTDRSPWGDFWFQPVGRMSGAGVRVTPESALALTAVWACVRVLAESFAVLPFTLYRPKAGGGRERVTSHWLYRLFVKAPNRFQTPFEWREMLQGHLALRGNAYCQITEDGKGGIAELLPLHPDRMRIELLDNGSYRYRYSDQAGREIIYSRSEIWHLRGLSSDGYFGMSPIDVAREAIGEGLAMQSYSSRFFANDARPGGGWIEFPGKFADKAAKTTFRESWQENQSGMNRGKVAVLEQGMKYHELGLNNKDSQFVEARAMKVSEIARIWRIPPHKIGDLAKATFSNIEQQSIEFWQDAMLPWSERWESSIEFFLLGEDSDLEVEFDMRRMMRGDASARATYISTLVNAGVLVRNEGRDMEGYDPLPGLDEPLVPLNMIEEGEQAEQGAPAPAPQEQPDDDDQAASKRLQAVVQASAQRLARRAARALEKQPAAEVFDSDFAAIVAESLAITAKHAQEFCDWAIAYQASPALAKNVFEQHATLMLTTYGTMK